MAIKLADYFQDRILTVMVMSACEQVIFIVLSKFLGRNVLLLNYAECGRLTLGDQTSFPVCIKNLFMQETKKLYRDLRSICLSVIRMNMQLKLQPLSLIIIRFLFDIT